MVFFLSWSESLSKKRRNLYLISQNHRIPWAGRDPGWSLSPAPDPTQGNLSWSYGQGAAKRRLVLCASPCTCFEAPWSCAVLSLRAPWLPWLPTHLHNTPSSLQQPHLLPCTPCHLLIPYLHALHEWLPKHLCRSTMCTDKGHASCPPQSHKSTSLKESDLTVPSLETCSRL